MRKDVDLTGFEIVDLSDQPKKAYLLIWIMKSGKRGAVWVDEVLLLPQSNPRIAVGVRRIEEGYDSEQSSGYAGVISFPIETEWILLEQSYVETFSLEESYANNRGNVSDRIRLNRLMEETVQRGEVPSSESLPARGVPEPSIPKDLEGDFEKWYREQRGER